ncbi:hypothetical protein TEA_000126 [Camellia sinensis var. sinensis]|uniref:U1-type domain-containing protein n=1 Tax=Camellia sinensis var. sinensis TaxID=542762 RepID=A0A4S4E349_CAMSN|nr:hypothetical protein TEA_000126 [Camellia sinensis var. sinensis]
MKRGSAREVIKRVTDSTFTISPNYPTDVPKVLGIGCYSNSTPKLTGRVLLLSVWECVVKDSANYLDHINGKKHQRALGMSMRVEQASLEQVHVCKNRRQQRRKTEVDADVAAMMGFGGFGSSKK